VSSLVAWLRTCQNGSASGPLPGNLRALAGGRNNRVYAWRQDSGVEICVKVYRVDERQRAEREWSALTLLRELDIRGVPRPLWLDAKGEPPVMGMTLLPGRPLDRAPGKRALVAMAEHHAALRRVPLRGMLATTPRVDNWAHYVTRLTRIWPDQLQASPADDLTRRMWALLSRWRDVGDAEESARDVPKVFSRGDANLVNWHWQDDRVFCVDFEFAGYSDVAFDIADLVEHISARVVPDDVWSELLTPLGPRPEMITFLGRATDVRSPLAGRAVEAAHHARGGVPPQLARAEKLLAAT
jgi:Ser/Thr protein kinase RdoA (MazF antagonist)